MDFSSFSSSSLSSYFNLSFTALIFFISLFLVLLLSRKAKSKQVKLPPGPPGWPVVGNLFQLARSGKEFFQYVRDLQPKYGPIFSLKLGTRTVIIVTSPELAHEALIEKGQVFANRPAEHATRAIFSSNKFTVNSATYGPTWRSLRRNMVQGMLSSTRVKDFREVRNSAMNRLISRLQAEAESTEGVVSVLKCVRFAVFCILLDMCFGVQMGEETIEKIDETLKDVLVTLLPRLDDFLPMLGPFFLKQKKRALEVREEQMRTILPLIEKRRSKLLNPGSDENASTFAYLDTLFDLKIEGRKSAPSEAELVSLCSEFLNGGTDTTATAIEWGMARLIQKPEIQSRLYSEIKSIVGDRTVDEGDIEKMPYLNAFTKELLRKHPPTYFVLSHAVTQRAKLAGYDIPVNASVEFFSAAIGEDSKTWSNPKEFDPDRFFTGSEDADITGVTGVKMVPFGVGRRICPGLGIGTTHIKLMIARMVQEFEWSAPPSEPVIDFTETLQFTVVMKTPLQAMMKPRI
ncbi:Cytochrome p450 [Thalictrum thalictroides]|uniref:Cytochrome p450 n=1 Tax=Thalictrum thalictroides TaxID=46969 RepID=A0A7J6VEY8_THATH|nr:Cytochrome p450 [Thalictrum thalictroides]